MKVVDWAKEKLGMKADDNGNSEAMNKMIGIDMQTLNNLVMLKAQIQNTDAVEDANEKNIDRLRREGSGL